MEFPFELDFLHVDNRNGLSCWDQDFEKVIPVLKWRSHFCQVVNMMGSLSAKAQNLLRSLTTSAGLLHSNQRLYIFSPSKQSISAILKVGKKKLFVHVKLHQVC